MAKIVRQYGYLAQLEDRDFLDHTGSSPSDMMAKMADGDPPTYSVTADPWLQLDYQGSQGACQGHALAHMAQVVFAQTTGVKRQFSRAQCYYESQRHDGIRGDRGSTLSGGAKVATEDGIVLEKDWKYPTRYNANRPPGYADMPRVTFEHSRRLTDVDELWAFLEAGGAVQTGVTWNSSCEQDYADKFRPGGAGGHSTLLYGFRDDDELKWCVHHNSWKNWGINGEGRSYWSRDFIAGLLRQRWSVFIGYRVGDHTADDRIF